MAAHLIGPTEVGCGRRSSDTAMLTYNTDKFRVSDGLQEGSDQHRSRDHIHTLPKVARPKEPLRAHSNLASLSSLVGLLTLQRVVVVVALTGSLSFMES